MISPEEVQARLALLQARILAACGRAGRAPEAVRLVAVSKGQPAEAIRAARAAGQRVFGENYVQELSQKALALRDLDLEWHFVGTLQRNKARKVLEVARTLHTVDRAELGRALARLSSEVGAAPPTLLVEVNVGGESSKGGVAPAALGALLAALRAAGLPAAGLMTVPPPGEPEEARPHFAALRELARAHIGPDAALSMGMSDDFEVAIEEGATLVRVGTALFGPRALPVG